MQKTPRKNRKLIVITLIVVAGEFLVFCCFLPFVPNLRQDYQQYQQRQAYNRWKAQKAAESSRQEDMEKLKKLMATEDKIVADFTAKFEPTLSKFNALSYGMSYDKVVQIIGDSGTEVSGNKIEGVPGVMDDIETTAYTWTNSDGSNMMVMFQNDKLIQKSQFGLK